MDTVAPTHTNWWWGEVTTSVARLYIQATDSTSGIARVACPTSTESGGYNNWYWFETVWDSAANAYRADITPSTFGHYGQTYLTHLYIWDNAGNGGYYNQATVGIPEDWNGTIYESGEWKWAKFQSSFTRRWANNYNGGYYGTGVYSGTDYVGVAAASNGGVACTGVDVSTNDAFNSGDYRYINFVCQPGNFAWGQYAFASLGVSTESTLTSDSSLTRVMTTTNLGWEASRTVQVAINTNTNYYIHFFCGNEYITDGGSLNTALKVTKIWLSK